MQRLVQQAVLSTYSMLSEDPYREYAASGDAQKYSV